MSPLALRLPGAPKQVNQVHRFQVREQTKRVCVCVCVCPDVPEAWLGSTEGPE